MHPGQHVPNPLRRLVVVLVAFLAVVVYGTTGYSAIEHYPLLDAAFCEASRPSAAKGAGGTCDREFGQRHGDSIIGGRAPRSRRRH